MDEILKNLPQRAKDTHNENKKFFAMLKKKPPKHLDALMQELNDSEFERTDCLTCANCCKTTGPLFTDKDVERLAKNFRMKEAVYLHIRTCDLCQSSGSSPQFQWALVR